MPTLPCIPAGRTAPRSPSCWGRVRAPQTQPGDHHWGGEGSGTPRMDTAESCPALALPNTSWEQGWDTPGWDGAQPARGLPTGFLLRENTFPVLLEQGRMWEQQWPGSPGPWLSFQLHVGLQEQQGAGTAPSRWLLSRWRCPRCPSRLPTNPGRTWLLLLLEVSLEQEGERGSGQVQLPRANPSEESPAWLAAHSWRDSEGASSPDGS